MTRQAKAERQVEADRQEAITHLRKMIRPGATVYTILRHVSRTGMSRGIDVYVIRQNRPVWITGYVGKAIGCPQGMADWQNQRGLRIGGCGQDMGFHVVYNLGRALFPDGFVPAKCGVQYGRNGAPATDLDPDGGYALTHKWI